MRKLKHLENFGKVYMNRSERGDMKVKCQKKIEEPWYTKDFDVHSKGNGKLLKGINSGMMIFEFKQNHSSSTVGH